MTVAVVRSLGSPRRLDTVQETQDFEQEIVDQYLLASLGAGVDDALGVRPVGRPTSVDGGP